MAFVKLLMVGDPVTDLTGTGYKLPIVSNGAVTQLAHGTSGKFLKSSGSLADPTWDVASVAALDDITDVVVTSVADDEVLSWETNQWINKTAAEAGLMVTPLPSNSVGASAIDETATDIAFSQIILTPKTTGAGTAEGTLFYDSDDDHVYAYVSA